MIEKVIKLIFLTLYVALNAANLSTSQVKTSDWDTGFCETVEVKNLDSKSLQWQVEFVSDGAINNMWNANYTQDASRKVTASGVSWNNTLASNQVASFGYCADKVVIPPSTDSSKLILTKTITNSWNGGFCEKVSIANNESVDVIWDISTSVDGEIYTLWNANYTQGDDLVLNAQGLAWNEIVKANSTRSFGYCANEVETPPSTDSSKLVLTKNRTSSWNSGFCETVSIANNENEDIKWDISTPVEGEIYNLWNANYTQGDDLVLNAQGLAWNEIVKANSTRNFGYCANVEVVTPPNTNVEDVARDKALLTFDRIKNLNTNISNITTNLHLVSSGNSGTAITWSSSNTAVISNTGTVTRSVNDETVTLTATISKGDVSDTQSFTLVVVKEEALGTPTSPSSLNATLIGNTKVNFTWVDNSDNEDAFLVYKNVNDTGWELVTSLATNTQNYDNFEVETAKSYKFKVEAKNLAGVASSEIIDVNPLNTMVQTGTLNDAVSIVANCMACHTQTDSNPSIPVIHGLSKSYLEQTLKGYRTSDTTANHFSFAMHRIMDGYTDDEIDLMTEYFSSQTWVGNDVESDDVESIVLGKTLYETNCVSCHGTDAMQDDIILLKQSEQYLVDTMTNYAKGLHKDAHVGMKSVFENTIGDNALNIEALAKYLAVGLEVPSDVNDSIRGFTATYVSDSNQILASWEYIRPEVSSVEVLINGMVVQTLTDLTGLSILINNDGTNPFVLEESYDVQLKAVSSASEKLTSLISILIKTDTMYGEEHYNTNCKVCHGVNGTARADITQWNPNNHTFAEYTQASIMPESYYANCDDECLDLIGTYVLNVLEPRAREDNSTEVTDASSDISRGYRLLNTKEYANTLYSLFEIQNDTDRLETLGFESTDLPQDNVVEGFNTDRDVNRISESRLKAFIAKAESLEAYIDSLKGQEGTSCLISNFDFCVADKSTFLSTFGTKIFRRPLVQSEITQYEALESIGKIVGDMLVSPNFLYRSEMGTETNTTGIYQLTNYEIATAIAYTVAGTTPDDTLLGLAENGQLLDENTRVVQAVRLSTLETGKEKLADFVGRWLLEDDVFSLSDKNPERFPGYDNEVRTAQSEQVLEYFRMVMESNSKSAYKDLFINDYIMTNSVLSDYYGNGLSNSETFEKVLATSKRYGVLTLGALASKYANSEESHPFKRGDFVLERLMCHEIGIPQNAGDVPAIQEHAGENKRNRFAEHVNDSTCATCHVFMDPIGYTWENYDGTGRYRTSEYHSEEDGGPKVIDASVTLKGLLTLNESESYPANSIRDVSQIIADSDRGPECMALQYYRYTSGDTHVELENSLVVKKIVADFKEQEYDLQSLFTNIVKLNSFITRKGE